MGILELFQNKENSQNNKEGKIKKNLRKTNLTFKTLESLERNFIILRQNFKEFDMDGFQTLITAEDKTSKLSLEGMIRGLNEIIVSYEKLSKVSIRNYNTELKLYFNSFNSTGLNTFKKLKEFARKREIFDNLHEMDLTIDGEFENIIVGIQSIKSKIVQNELNKKEKNS